MALETPETASKAKSAPKLVKLDRARKIAESWVNNKTRSPDDESSEEKEQETRPARLGLGAKVTPQARLGPSTDPAGKTAAKTLEEEPKANNGQASDDDDDEEPESRTNAFTKKIVVPVPPCLQRKKK
ncbi:hypothetical protein MKX01_005064 [Papaver californicum]|nr:hypothetical protein MKX01_005064 [Papaver californicum]